MRRRRTLPLIISFLVLALVFGSIGFVTAYYKYSGQIARERSERQKEQELLQALIKAQEDYSYNTDENNGITVTNYNDTINNDTELIYKTLHTQCEDTVEEVQKPEPELIGLNKDGFEKYLIENQQDWEIESFSKEKIVLSRQANKVCPSHYLVIVDNGYITIYKYNEDGSRELVEQTDIPINILPVMDQEKLRKGILLDTKKEVNQLLEDYGS
ncbi:MAG TPA: BofC C-terminal domain-containing protein [Oscillospiraceae bacterium]|nr:BofC C-terminal domain-containing protein [Oscillospiraceae bacterium]